MTFKWIQLNVSVIKWLDEKIGANNLETVKMNPIWIINLERQTDEKYTKTKKYKIF